MPTIKNLTEDTAAVVGLTAGNEDYVIDGYYLNHYKLWASNAHIDLPVVDLPPGQWSIVGWSDELTEEQAQLICHSIFGRYYKDFMSKETEGYAPTWTLETATESFASLLRSHGITDRALIIKKEK